MSGGKPKAITGDRLAFVLRLDAEGASHSKIARGLEAELGVRLDARTVGRTLAAMGKARRPRRAAEAWQAGAPADVRPLAAPTPAAADLGASEGQPGAALEVEILLDNLGRLRADMARQIPPADRARVSSEIRAVVARLSALEAAGRARELGEATTLGAADRVRARLQRAEAQREQAREAALARLPPHQRVEVERALAVIDGAAPVAPVADEKGADRVAG